MRKTNTGCRGSSGTAYFSNKQMGEYLQNLRSNPVPRPPGARPLVQSRSRSSLVTDTVTTRGSAMSNTIEHSDSSMCSSALSSTDQDEISMPARVSRERMYWPSKANWNQRQQEMEEARMMRDVLAFNSSGEDEKIHADARREAEMLMWQHQNPHAPYRISEGPSSRAGIERPQNDSERRRPGPDSAHHASHGYQGSPRKSSNPFSLSRLSLNGRSRRRRTASSGTQDVFPNEEESIYEDDAAFANTQDSMMPAPLTLAGRKPFRNTSASYANILPADTLPTKISQTPQDIFGLQQDSYSRMVQNADPGAQIDDWEDETRYRDGVEIRSKDIRAATSMKRRERSPNLPSPVAVSDRPDRPIVSFNRDWQPEADLQHYHQDERLAHERPSPVPHRPFRNQFEEQKSFSEPVVPTVLVTDPVETPLHQQPRPPIPKICEPNTEVSETDCFPQGNVPSIHFNQDYADPPQHDYTSQETSAYSHSVPQISIQQHSPFKPQQSPQRPRPHHTATAPVAHSEPLWRARPQPTSPSILCAQCALPISGRTVTAASARFHPSCFTCHTCHQSLEHVGFHPEPPAYRTSRLERILLRQQGESVEPPTGVSMEDDEDDSLRFYCQLDFHELFSPRCRTCKTPIEGQVIEACGAFYHASPNHFFCAQCGDPFDNATPYIEASSYAWCVRCHTARFSTKCRACKQPILEASVEALGGEYHEECFRCLECSGELAGGRFLEREKDGMLGPVCLECGGSMRVVGFRELWNGRNGECVEA